MYIAYLMYSIYLILGGSCLFNNFNIILYNKCINNDLYYYIILSLFFSYFYSICLKFDYTSYDKEKLLFTTLLLLCNIILIFYGVDCLFLPTYRCYNFLENIWVFGITNLLIQLCFITYIFIITSTQYYMYFYGYDKQNQKEKEDKINVV